MTETPEYGELASREISSRESSRGERISVTPSPQQILALDPGPKQTAAVQLDLRTGAPRALGILDRERFGADV